MDDNTQKDLHEVADNVKEVLNENINLGSTVENLSDKAGDALGSLKETLGGNVDLGDMVDGLKDKVMGATGLGTITDKVENMVDSAKDKIGSIFGQKGEDAIDSAVEKVEDTIKDVTGVNVDLNNEEPGK